MLVGYTSHQSSPWTNTACRAITAIYIIRIVDRPPEICTRPLEEGTHRRCTRSRVPFYLTDVYICKKLIWWHTHWHRTTQTYVHGRVTWNEWIKLGWYGARLRTVSEKKMQASTFASRDLQTEVRRSPKQPTSVVHVGIYKGLSTRISLYSGRIVCVRPYVSTCSWCMIYAREAQVYIKRSVDCRMSYALIFIVTEAYICTLRWCVSLSQTTETRDLYIQQERTTTCTQSLPYYIVCTLCLGLSN